MQLHHLQGDMSYLLKLQKSINQQIKMFIQVIVRDTLRTMQMRRNI